MMAKNTGKRCHVYAFLEMFFFKIMFTINDKYGKNVGLDNQRTAYQKFHFQLFYILLCDVGPNVSFSSYMSVADTIDLEQFEDSATFSA